jgi:hypothetical protein
MAMQFRILARAAALFCAIHATAGCQYSPDTAERTIEFNRSVALSTDQQFLLNAVRASKREPTYYSRITSNQATSTINPAISSTVPWGSGKSVATTITPPGSVTASSVATTIAKAALTLTPSVGLTETNQLTLSNPDDQASTEGLLNPVPLQLYTYFQNEGFNAEELLMMFVGSVSLTKQQLSDLKTRFTALCDAAAPAAQIVQCKYYAERKASELEIWRECEHSPDRAGVVSFANDPSRYQIFKKGRRFVEFDCFQRIERAFLALGYTMTPTATHDLAYWLPLDAVKENPRYLADLAQQQFEVSVIPYPSTKNPASDKRVVAVCKKTDTVSFQPPRTDASSAAPLDVKFVAHAVSIPDSGKDTSPPQSDIKSCGDAFTAAIDIEKGVTKPSTSAGAKISFGERSLEAMVYYLGQIIRRRVELVDTETRASFLAPIVFNSDDDPTGPKDVTTIAVKEVELFDVTTTAPKGDPIVQVEHGGTTYFVPSLKVCNEPPKIEECTAQNPDHASPQVLTLLNQIWGLQKTATTLPAPSSVTVISSH